MKCTNSENEKRRVIYSYLMPFRGKVYHFTEPQRHRSGVV